MKFIINENKNAEWKMNTLMYRPPYTLKKSNDWMFIETNPINNWVVLRILWALKIWI